MSAKVRLLALAALLAVVYSRSFVQRIERHRAPSPRARTYRNSRLKSGSQPFVNDNDHFYVGNITIGTPNQLFTVMLDTGSSDVWVIDCACRQQECKGDPDSGHNKHCYNPQASSTYAPNGAPFSIKYGLGSVHGYLGADVVRFGGDLVRFGGDLVDLNQTFGIATTVSDDFGIQLIDGILGLGWPAAAEDQVPPPVFQILSQLDKPVFTVWLDRHIKPSAGVSGGLITYGEIDTQNCDAHVDYVPLISARWWEFAWDGFSVGKSNFPGKQAVVSDTGAPWIYLLTPHYNALVKETGAQYNFKNDGFTVDCDAKNLPDIVLTIGGKKYNIPSSEYVLDLDIGGNQCAMAVGDNGDSSSLKEPSIILGDVFIRAYCTVYDIGQKRIGFAKTHHKETRSV